MFCFWHSDNLMLCSRLEVVPVNLSFFKKKFLLFVCLQLCFEYVPEQIDLVAQSSWNFVIDSLSVSVPFICIGTSREPLIYFSKPYVEFGELLVGTLT